MADHDSATAEHPGEQTGQTLTSRLTSGRLLARNTLWNLLGQTAALVVAVFTLPILVAQLGPDRLGVLLLIWMLVGYAGLFDLGVGRALTKMAADKIGEGAVAEIPPLFWTSMLLMTLFGLAAGVVTALLTPWIVAVLNVPQSLVEETRITFYLVALSLPVVISAGGLAGLLEAWQRFDLIAAVNIPLGILQYAGPLLVLFFTHSLIAIMGIILAARIAAWCVRLWMCLHVQPDLRLHVAWHSSLFGPLLRFGGWLTLTAVVSPLMVTFDRFVVGALTSVAGVAYYATPNEVVMRLLHVPAALASVLFPAFALTYVQAPERAVTIFGRTARLVFVCMFPLVLLTTALAPEWLGLWLGPDFAANSTAVVQLLAIGILFNSIGRLGFTFVTGAGQARWTGLLHLVELPIFLVTLYVLTLRYGIAGAAAAGTLRYALDTLAMLWMVQRLLPGVEGELHKQWLLLGGATLVLLSLMLPMSTAVRLAAATVCAIAFACLTWFWILSREERRVITQRVYR
jgi:O-antigen/teichoic acid export membrane protein